MSFRLRLLHALFIRGITAFLIILIGSSATLAQSPTILRVNANIAGGSGDGTSWANAYRYLQDALDEANANGSAPYEIWVAAGVYYPDEGAGHVDDDNAESFTLVYDNVQLYGGFTGTETERSQRDPEANLTILSGDIDQDDVTTDGLTTVPAGLSGDNAQHVLYLDGETNEAITADTVIDGFAITAGIGENGGGLYCAGSGSDNECSPSLANIIFCGNMVVYNGGAIYNNGASGGVSSPTLKRVTFSSNHSFGDGGAMYNNGNSGISSPTLTNVVFKGNRVRSGYGSDTGGAMVNNGELGVSSPTLVNVSFIDNSAANSGGAMYNKGVNGISNPTLTNVVFNRNSADSYGGGMYNYSSFNGTSNPTLTNVTFFGNSADDYGGGMYNHVFSGGTAAPDLTNVILWGNTAGTDGNQMYNLDAVPTIARSLVEGGCPAGATCTTAPLTDDPLFANAATDDLSLQAGSPAIDAGDSAALPPDTADLDGDSDTAEPIPRDLAGNSRIAGAAVDLGAYEGDANVAPQNTIPPTQAYSPNTDLIFSAANGNAISVDDADADGNAVQVSLTATNGTFSLSGIAGLGFSTGDGVDDATMTFTGVLTDLNTALDGLRFSPAPDYFDAASLQIETNDLGFTGLGGSQTDTDTVRINPPNFAPVFFAIGNQSIAEGNELRFFASTIDADGAAQTLTFSLQNAPNGATIDSASGAFRWTPAEAQAPGTYTTTVIVIDNGSPVLSDTETIQITATEVRQPPVLDSIGNKTLNEGETLSFIAHAADVDIPVDTLTYSLLNAPAGATFDSESGLFTWNTSETDGPGEYYVTVKATDSSPGNLSDSELIKVTVNESNQSPVLATIGDKSVSEGSELSFTATATDADVPQQTLYFTMQNAPEGATLTSDTGIFRWTPAEAQGPGVYDVTVQVADAASGGLIDSETIRLTVSEVNQPPVLAPIGAKEVNAEQTLEFQATATDTDEPAQTIGFALQNAPPGASIDSASGTFSWTPTAAQAPASYAVTVLVFDDGGGFPADSETITITVKSPFPGVALHLKLDEAADETEFSDEVSDSDKAECPTEDLLGDPVYFCPDSGVAGRFGNALRFDGLDDKVLIDYDVNKNAYSMSLWFKTTRRNVPLFKVDAIPNFELFHLEDNVVKLDNGNLCATSLNLESYTLTFDNSVIPDAQRICTSGTNFADGEWHHVVHTLSYSDTHRLFADGKLRAERPSDTPFYPYQYGAVIGFAKDAKEDFFKGEIDDVQLYDQALSAEQILGLYNTAYWRLNEDIGATRFADSTGNNNTAGCSDSSCPTAGESGVEYFSAWFDGNDDRLMLGNEAGFSGNGPFAITTWVKTTAAAEQIIAGQAGGQFELSIRPDGTVQWKLPNVFTAQTTLAVNDGEWHHVAAVRKSTGSGRIYIDGVPNAWEPGDLTTLEAGAVALGGPVTGGDNYFNGRLDDIRFYELDLAAAQIKPIMTAMPNRPISADAPANCSGQDIVLIDGDSTLAVIENVEIPGAQQSGCSFTGDMTLTDRGSTAESISVEGSVDANNIVSLTEIADFDIDIAGLTLNAGQVEFEDGKLRVKDPTVTIDDGWGGLTKRWDVIPEFTADGLKVDGEVDVPEIMPLGLAVLGVRLTHIKVTLQPVDDGYEFIGTARYGMNILHEIPLAGMECFVKAELTIYSSGGVPTLKLKPIEPIEATPAPAYSMLSASSSSGGDMALRELYLQFETGLCPVGIPIGASGLKLTSLEGTLSLYPGTEYIHLRATLKSLESIGPLNIVKLDGTLDAQADPMSIDFAGNLKILLLKQAANARAHIDSKTFRAEAEMNGDLWKITVEMNSWYDDDDDFHLIGSGAGAVVIDEGLIFDVCPPPHPCADICWSWRGPYVCWDLCDTPCVTVPSSSGEIGCGGVDFGEFSNGDWGFKGYVSLLGYTLGFFVDAEDGDIDLGNVDNYTLIEGPDILRAWQAQNAMRVAGTSTSTAADERYTFTDNNHVLINTDSVSAPSLMRTQDSPVRTGAITHTDTIFVLSSATPLTFTVRTPEGDTVTPANYAANPNYTIRYRQTVTRELARNETEADQSRRRFIFAATDPEFAPVDVLLDGTRVITNQSLITSTLDYMPVTTGTHTITVVPAGSSTELTIAPMTVITGTDATVVFVTGAISPELHILADDNSAPPMNQARVRAVNLIADDTIDILLGSTSLLTDASANTVGNYHAVADGLQTLTVRNDSETLYQQAITVTADSVSTFFVADLPPEFGAGDVGVLQTLDEEYQVVYRTEYIVDQAPPEGWDVALGGDITNPDYSIATLQAPASPILRNLKANTDDPAHTQISWELLSNYAPTQATLYAATGDISRTLTYTDSAGFPQTADIPIFDGVELASWTITDVDELKGQAVSHEVDLSAMPSDDYALWIRVEDGVTAPVNAYAASASDTAPTVIVRVGAEGYNPLNQLARAAEITIDHAATLTDTWDVDITAAINPLIPAWNSRSEAWEDQQIEGLYVKWPANPHPDVDSYVLSISPYILPAPAITLDAGYALQDVYDDAHQPTGEQVGMVIWDGVNPNETYYVQVGARDEDRNQIAWSPVVEVTFEPGSIELNTTTPSVQIATGQQKTVSLQATVSADMAYSQLLLSAALEELPTGISVDFSESNQTLRQIMANHRAAEETITVDAVIAVDTTVSVGDYDLPISVQAGELISDLSLDLSVVEQDITDSVYLPLIVKNSKTFATLAPDLVIESLTVDEGEITVVIRNQGMVATPDAFWVDVYLNPGNPPTAVNQPWDLLADQGATWGVTDRLNHGDAITLTLNDTRYFADYSRIILPIAAGTVVYAQVDSANANSTYGGILEQHEIDGTAYNNIAGPVTSTAGETGTILAEPTPIPLGGSSTNPVVVEDLLPPRK